MKQALHTLSRKTPRKDMRVGRGGKRGKTAGRGTKGQNARAGHKKRPEIRDFIKKLPKRRGFGKNRAKGTWSDRPKPSEVTIKQLEDTFDTGAVVSVKTLFEKKLIPALGDVKIIGNESLTKKLTIEGCRISKGAQAIVEKAGGTVAAV